MEPVTTTLIATSVAAALKAGVSELGKKAVGDGNEGLKAAIKKRFGVGNSLSKAIAELEQKQESEGKKIVLQETVEETQAHRDPEILAAARALLEQIGAQPGGEKHIQQIAQGSYIAQAEGGSAATVNVSQPK